MSDVYTLLTTPSTNKAFLNIYCSSVNSSTSTSAEFDTPDGSSFTSGSLKLQETLITPIPDVGQCVINAPASQDGRLVVSSQTLGAQTVAYVSDIPPPVPTVSDKIESNDLQTTAECKDGDIFVVNIAGSDRVTCDNIKSKMMCGVSALQLSAVSDGLSEATTTYMGASTGPTQNTISIYTPDQYQVIQNNGAVARIVVDTTSTKLNTKSILTGPQASFVDLNDDGRFAIGSLGANNGLIDASLGNLAIIGAGATSAIELALSPPKITTSVFNGSFRATREIIDQTTQTFYDPSNVERLRVDASGVTINNAYRMPTSDGTPSQVLQTNGFGAVGWATPQVYGLFSQISVKTVANTAVESSLIGTGVGGLTVPAGYFQDGYSFLYKTGGVFRDSSNGQLIRFRLRNSGVLFDTGNLTLSNVNTLRGWNIECQFTYYSGNIITNFSFSYTNGTNDAFGFTNQGTNAINNALPNTLDFTVQWGTANALNTISSNYGTLTKIF